MPWLFTSQAVGQSAGSLVQDANLISKIYFPRLALPISKALGLTLDFAISMVVVLAVMAVYGVGVSSMAFLVPLFLLLGVITAFGVGTLFAAVNVRYRDVALIVPVLLQIWIFASPVIYPGSLVSGPLEYVWALNPMVSVLNGTRWSLLGATAPDPLMVAVSVALRARHARPRGPLLQAHRALLRGRHMSRDIAIRSRGLSKRYSLGQMQGGYGMLREALADRVRSLGRARSEKNEFWALRDVDLEVERGETFGIIGHNGAGKSTLLKILARVTPPTGGEADLDGRVGALLEVGTGFHPELTGRENVYLNGAILGMGRAEISRKFDEIVEFADVDRFIDTP